MRVEKNALEWTVFAGSVLLLVALVVALASAGGPARPPELRVTLGDPERSIAGFRVPVTVENEGDETAALVDVEVRLEGGGADVERAELTFDFVPMRSRREGWATFARDPRCCRVVARVTGFQRP